MIGLDTERQQYRKSVKSSVKLTLNRVQAFRGRGFPILKLESNIDNESLAEKKAIFQRRRIIVLYVIQQCNTA